MANWFLYIIECRGGSLYTGITTDLEKRIKRHNQGVASKYTRAYRPVELKYKEVFNDKPSALKRESKIKALSRLNKLRMIRNSKLAGFVPRVHSKTKGARDEIFTK